MLLGKSLLNLEAAVTLEVVAVSACSPSYEPPCSVTSRAPCSLRSPKRVPEFRSVRSRRLQHTRRLMPSDTATCIAVTPVNIVCGYGSGKIRLFNASGKKVVEISAHCRWINAIDYCAKTNMVCDCPSSCLGENSTSGFCWTVLCVSLGVLPR